MNRLIFSATWTARLPLTSSARAVRLTPAVASPLPLRAMTSPSLRAESMSAAFLWNSSPNRFPSPFPALLLHKSKSAFGLPIHATLRLASLLPPMMPNPPPTLSLLRLQLLTPFPTHSLLILFPRDNPISALNCRLSLCLAFAATPPTITSPALRIPQRPLAIREFTLVISTFGSAFGLPWKNLEPKKSLWVAQTPRPAPSSSGS